nr:glycosyltransferase [Okeania hirsuta]
MHSYDNVANLIAIELSLLFSFFVYRIWVWPGGSWTFREVFWRQLPLYHVSAGTAVVARIFLVFPLLDWWGVNYAINTLVGVLINATLNYVISDNLVFKTPVKHSHAQRQADFSSEIYYPEGLAPALAHSCSLPKPPRAETSKRIKVFSIVIPAHNEEGCIVTTVQSISQLLEAEKIAYEILVVNDNSRDRTEALLRQLSAQNSKVRYINNYYPNGFGFAIRCGLENFLGDGVAIVMADSSDAPENIVDYYYKLQEGYDCVFGFRFIRGLAPALAHSCSLPKPPRAETSKRIKVFSIVIPAHNEEGCIVTTVQSISQLLEAEKIAYEILVVNDNSRDRTEALLRQLSAQNSKVRYINNYYPNGFGFAIRCGLENFLGDGVAIVMADSSDAPENIVDYYYKLQEGYDCVFGFRFIRGGKVIDYPTHKLMVNRLANLFISVLFGLKFNDTTNAFKAYRREVIEGISPLLSHHFNLTVEMPLKAIARQYSYTTMPITWRNRTTGLSKLKLKEMGSRYLFIVLYIWLEKHLSRGDYVCKQPQIAIQNKIR